MNRPCRRGLTVLTLLIVFLLGDRCALSSQTPGVYMVAFTPGASPFTSVYQFTRDGVGVDFFGGAFADETYVSIASNGTDFFVGELLERISRFSQDGAFLGYFGTQTFGGPRLEFDSHGSLYVTSEGTALRFASDGTVSQAFPLLRSFGIDADADGNVYVHGSVRPAGGIEGIYKYDRAGSLIGFTPTPEAPDVGDMAIDEINKILYVTSSDMAFSVKAYDISGPTAAFLTSIPTPTFFVGLSFEPASGHLFGTGDLSGRGWEISTNGTVINLFDLGSSTFPWDIVAVPVPEPLTISLLSFVVAVAFSCSRNARHRRR